MTSRGGKGRPPLPGLKTGLLTRLLTGLLSCVVAAGLVAGCTSVRSDLGTSDSSCYIALPAATRAVGSHGHLIGVHLYTVATLRRRVPMLFDALAKEPNRPNPSQRICVVAFEGSFTRSTVSKPVGLPSGTVAVVVSKFPSNQLLGTAVVDRPPVHFGHTHIG